jgi:uncharacterized protein (DUF433 family)
MRQSAIQNKAILNRWQVVIRGLHRSRSTVKGAEMASVPSIAAFLDDTAGGWGCFHTFQDAETQCQRGSGWNSREVANPPERVFNRAMNESVVVQDPEILGGTPVFAGTRVPVRNLLDYLEGSYTLDEFLDDFPGVTKTQAIAFLEQASAKLLVPA